MKRGVFLHGKPHIQGASTICYVSRVASFKGFSVVTRYRSTNCVVGDEWVFPRISTHQTSTAAIVTIKLVQKQ